jgi:hypothetical protein
VPHKDSELPTFLLAHPPQPAFHRIYFTWFDVVKQFADHAQFYCLEDAKLIEPEILQVKQPAENLIIENPQT